MKISPERMYIFPAFRRTVIIIAVLWTIVTIIACLFHFKGEYERTMSLARGQARQAIKKDVIYRHWAAIHGGVYVPISEITAPDPYLSHLKHRDVTTADGLKLTLVNPAYMTRQVHELGISNYGEIGHITSRNPIRSENRPDPWEDEALKKFAGGETEVSSIELIGDREYMRMMQPLSVDESCLKCHEYQGHKVGDIHGGISVSIPMDDYRQAISSHIFSTSLIYGISWACGIVFLFLFLRLSTKYLQEFDETTRSLSEANQIINRSPAVAFLWQNSEGWPVLFVTENVRELLGYSGPDFMEGRISYAELIYHGDMERVTAEVVSNSADVEIFSFHHDPYRVITKDDGIKWVEDTTYIRRDKEGNVTHYEGVVLDITEKKESLDSVARQAAIFEESLNESYTFAYDSYLFQKVNRGARDNLGYSLEELQKMTPLDLKKELTTEEFVGVLQPLKDRTKEKIVFVTTHRRKNGSFYPVEVHLQLLEGKPAVFLAMATDISRRVEQERRISHLSLVRQTMLNVHHLLASNLLTAALMQEVCDIFVRDQGYYSAWFALTDQDGCFNLTGKCDPAGELACLDEMFRKRDYPPCIGNAVRSRTLAHGCKLGAQCSGCFLEKDDLATGFMTMPLLYEEELLGVCTVTLALEVVNEFEEQEVFREIINDIAFALHNREQEYLRMRHELDLASRDKISRAFILNDDDSLYGEVLNIVLDTLKSKIGVFGYLDGPDRLVCPFMSGIDLDKRNIKDKTNIFPREKWAGIWKQALLDGMSYGSNDRFQLPEGHSAIENCVATGIVSKGEVIGLLMVANREGGFGPDDYRMLENLASVIAPILHARLAGEKMERERNKVLAEFADLYNNAPDMFFSVDAKSKKIIKCNQTVKDKIGYAMDELVGRVFLELYHPDCLDRITNKILPAFETTGRIINEELLVICKDGSALPVTLEATAVRDNDGNIIQSRSTLHDISERKKLDEQLLVTEKMTTIAGLAAGVSHEINTPLSGILQSIQLIEMGLDPQDRQNVETAAQYNLDLSSLAAYLQKKELDYFLDGIRSSATKASKIVADLLQFSRPQDMTKTEADPAELINRSIELSKTDYLLKKEYNIQDVTFVVDCSPDLAVISCMAMEIEQVLINLIKNACQAMAAVTDRNPLITVRTKLKKKMAVIEVEDNGPGIEPGNISKIFDPFFTTKDVNKGAGLGLAVSYSIIKEKHGGTMRVASEVGKGTIFTIEIPAMDDAATTENVTAPERSG